MKTNPTALCLDLGGTSLKMGIVQGEKLLAFATQKTDVENGLQGIKNTYRTAKDFSKDFDFDFVSVSSAGRIDSQNAICVYATNTLPCYTGFKIAEFLQSIFPAKPVFAINDGYAAGLGEYHAIKGTGTMLMLTIGTGLGGVIINNGNIENFPADRDMGHLELVPNGLPCTCGRRGCLECYTSGSALNALLAPFEPHPSDRQNRWQNYRLGHPQIRPAIDSWLAHLLSAIDAIYALHPFDSVVLGGGVADDGAFWFNPTLFSGKPYSAHLASLANTAGLFGAYHFAITKLNS